MNEIIKIILAILGNIFTGYLLIAGLINPSMIGYVKNYDGSFIQPETLIFQMAGWLIMLCVYSLITLYLILKINKK